MKIVVGILVILIIAAGGLYWFSNMNPSTPVGQEQTPAQNSGTAYVSGNLLLGTDANATLGTYLIGSNGMTLYKYTKDAANVSNCSGQCAANWPPYTISSRDVLANVQAGIPGKVDAIARADGTMQVTYNGSPLYFWINDKKSGDVAGQNVGGVWFVVNP